MKDEDFDLEALKTDAGETPIKVGLGIGKPIRRAELINTQMIKNKLGRNIDAALELITNRVNGADEKLAYKAANDLLAHYVTFARLTMQEEAHKEDLRFKKYKNKLTDLTLKQREGEKDVDKVGGNVDIPDAKFSTDFDNFDEFPMS